MVLFIELVPKMTEGIGIHATAGIGDSNHSLITIELQSDGDFSILRSELEGVGEYVVPHQGHQLLVSKRLYALGYLCYEINVLPAPYILKRQERGAYILR